MSFYPLRLFFKKSPPVSNEDRSTSYSPPRRDAYLVTGLADCIVITVLNILHRARELTNVGGGGGGGSGRAGEGWEERGEGDSGVAGAGE